MASSVHTEDAVPKVTLHQVLEVQHVLAVRNKAGDVPVRAGGGGSESADISADTSRVVAKTVRLRVGRHVSESRGTRTQINSQALEGTTGDTATTDTGRDANQGKIIRRDADISVSLVCTVAAHGSRTAIEHRGVEKVVGVSAPVDVRLVAGVAALVAKGRLVRPCEVAMPREEVTLMVINNDPLAGVASQLTVP